MPSDSNHPPIVPLDTPLPPPPPGVRYVRVPIVGIVIATDHRRRRVDRFFHWPMIVLALAILPLLLIEFIKQPDGALRVAVQIGKVELAAIKAAVEANSVIGEVMVAPLTGALQAF